MRTSSSAFSLAPVRAASSFDSDTLSSVEDFMKRTLLLSTFLAIPAVAVAQTPAAPTTRAAGCVGRANDDQTKRIAALRASGKPLTSALLAPITAEGRRMAQACADSIPMETASVAE